MNDINIYNFNGAEIRIQRNEQGDPLFCLADICKALELTTPARVRDRLDEKGVSTIHTLTPGGPQKMVYVDEANLYMVIFQSRAPKAKAFNDWVTREVLPSIRKTGGYMVSTPDETPDQIMARAILLAKDTIDRQKAQIAEQTRQIEEKTAALAVAAPKVAFVDAFCVSTGDITVANLAKCICQALGEKKFGQKVLYQYLTDNGYITEEHYPSQRAAEMGVVRLAQAVRQHRDGSLFTVHWSVVPPKGQTYFFEKIREKYNAIGRWW